MLQTRKRIRKSEVSGERLCRVLYSRSSSIAPVVKFRYLLNLDSREDIFIGVVALSHIEAQRRQP
jgi:hypothetical protein